MKFALVVEQSFLWSKKTKKTKCQDCLIDEESIGDLLKSHLLLQKLREKIAKQEGVSIHNVHITKCGKYGLIF